MLSHVAQAFDPETRTAWDDSRQAWLLESVHMQHLTAQLCDHEAEIQGLHEQIFNLHQELDHVCCYADKAEMELRFVERMGRSPSKRGRHQEIIRRGPDPLM